ncbi:MAG: rod shape-determining protein MreC [Dysgonamonadaceae bacterium]
MRNLIKFIIRSSHWIVTTLLVVFSFYLVFSHNSYQRSVYLSSANQVIGTFYSISDKVNSFFHLRKNSQLLLELNAQLQTEVHSLKETLSTFTSDSINANIFTNDSVNSSQFNFIPAEVVNVSFSGLNNYMTLNKGKLDGIKPDMGVISQTGIAGVILSVSDHFSVVIPIVNPKFRVSARRIKSINSGSIAWGGIDINYAELRELPKHESFVKGDTVVTSFSRIFPKDMIIGFINKQVPSADDKFNAFEVKLATNFHSIREVMVIEDMYYDELNTLETIVKE